MIATKKSPRKVPAPSPAPALTRTGGYISTLQAARLCGVSVFSVQRWFDEGLLTGSTLPGGRRRIGTASLESFMRKHIIPRSSATDSLTRKVLLVDDDAKLLGVMRESLESAGGLLVRTASSGLEAGIALGEFQPEIIVLDVMLEDVPAPLLMKRVREAQVGRNIRIVAISGKASESDVREMLRAGASAFLRKPFTIAELLKAMNVKSTAASRN